MSRVSVESFTAAASDKGLRKIVPAVREVDPEVALTLWHSMFHPNDRPSKEKIFLAALGMAVHLARGGTPNPTNRAGIAPER